MQMLALNVAVSIVCDQHGGKGPLKLGKGVFYMACEARKYGTSPMVPKAPL